jgi:hypothetical protein
MLFNDSPTELVVELAADLNEIGNEEIWAFSEIKDGKKYYTDYRYKNTPEDEMPKGRPDETVEPIEAKKLLILLADQHGVNYNSRAVRDL